MERINRRQFLRTAGGAVAAAAVGVPILNSTQGVAGASPLRSAGRGLITPKRGGTANLAIQDVPVNMDPADGELYASLQVYQNIFSALLDVDANYKYSSDLASAWQQEDPLTWKFTLVDNAYFQNGEPVTSTDVQYTINRMKTAPLGVYLANFSSVEVLTPTTFRIHLAHPYGPMEATLATLVEITNEKAITSTNPELHPIGCGPYKLTNWVHGSSVSLERWDKYFRPDKPYLDEVVFKTISDPTVALAALQTNEVQWIQGVPPQQTSSLLSSSSISHSSALPALPYLYSLNTRQAPFNNVNVRQAVAWAIDRAEIVKLAFFGTAVSATEAVSPPNPWYSGVNPYSSGPDLDKAMALMKKSGVGDVTVTYLLEAGQTVQEAMGELIKSQLAPLGITVNIITQASSEWFDTAVKGGYGLLSTYFSASVDPALAYYLLCYSTSVFNLSGLKSPKLDSLLNDFTFQSDHSLRVKYYPELVSAVAEEAATIFVSNQEQQYWTVPSLQGSQPYPDLTVRAYDMWLNS